MYSGRASNARAPSSSSARTQSSIEESLPNDRSTRVTLRIVASESFGVKPLNLGQFASAEPHLHRSNGGIPIFV